jgi:hypothetical protein
MTESPEERFPDERYEGFLLNTSYPWIKGIHPMAAQEKEERKVPEGPAWRSCAILLMFSHTPRTSQGQFHPIYLAKTYSLLPPLSETGPAGLLDSSGSGLFFNLPLPFHLAAYACFMISRGHKVP